jgi:molybdopterin molybdotransferase
MTPVRSSLGRVMAEDLRAPHPLPEFRRASVDGYAVRASDTFGAGDSLPAYLTVIGESPMGAIPTFTVGIGQCGLIHTGGMLPSGADAVVMLEYTQRVSGAGPRNPGDLSEPGRALMGEIEVHRAVAHGENVIEVGEDVAKDQVVLAAGTHVRPAEIGGLMALGIAELRVVTRPQVGLVSTGDEVVPAARRPGPGQVRDVNTHTLAALVEKTGGRAMPYGIVQDDFAALQAVSRRALEECSLVLITAGSSASTRDMTAEVINTLGRPGVLAHGINTRPGKPTILGVCDGTPVIGLPGNPLSALVNGYLFVVPVIERLLGAIPRPRPTILAELTVNLSSQAGREDWWPVRLLPSPAEGPGSDQVRFRAEPIFGKSNLIFNLAAADGLLKIAADATGLHAGDFVEVLLI